MADPRDILRTGSSSLVPRADRRRQLVALGTISGLVLLAFGLWSIVILTSSDRDQLEIAEGPSPAAERPVPGEEAEEEGAEDDRTTGDEAAAEEPDREAPDVTAEERADPEPDIDWEPDTDPEPDIDWDSAGDAESETDTEAPADSGSEDDTTPEADSDPEADPETDASSESDTGSEDDTSAEPDSDPEPDIDDRDDLETTDDTAVERVTIDGVCTVELDASERDGAPLRAWEFADCAYAPVPLDDGGERWIVVRASMSSGDVDAAGAQERASDLGVDGGVLWSSHYPSLNPGLWVAYDGPFPDAEAARNAAEAVDGEAYARALAADGGAR